MIGRLPPEFPSTVSAASHSTPQTTAIVAVEVASATIGDDARGTFDRIVAGVARQHGVITRDDDGPNFVLTVDPSADVGPVLLTLKSAFVEFERAHAPLRIRALAHHGVVFPSQNGSERVYLGSAIRAARNALRRVPASHTLMATRDFADFASGLPSLGRHFQLNPPDVECEGLLVLRIATRDHPAGGTTDSRDKLLEFLKKRLADDVGPFAIPLVENASQVPMPSTELIAALAKEIDNPDARRRFADDALAFVEAMRGGARAASPSTAPSGSESGAKAERGGLLGRLLKR